MKGKTTFKDVLTRLQNSFLSLTSEEIYGCIRKADKELINLDKYIRSQDAADDNLTAGEQLESKVSFSGSSRSGSLSEN